MNPIHVAANGVPELVEPAGGDYGLAEPGQRSRELQLQTLVECAPEVLVLGRCSYPVDRIRERLDELADRAG